MSKQSCYNFMSSVKTKVIFNILLKFCKNKFTTQKKNKLKITINK